VRILHRLAKWVAVRSYRNHLGPLLVGRYGRERRYTPAQVLTTIKLHGLSERFAAYACVMFCSKQAYSEFVANQVASAGPSVSPLKDSSVPLWAGVLVQDWPTHHHVVADLGHSQSDLGSGPFGDQAAHLADRSDSGGGGHDGGESHDGGDGSP
jgi:hypothetical protein